MHTSRFAQYAHEESKRMFLGTLIKFVQGDWVSGPDKVPISRNTRFVAVMDTTSTGYIKWFDGKPTDSRMGLVADGFRAPYRDTLDDFDSTHWEVDGNGDLVDPWQKTNVLVFVSPTESHDLFTFTTTTEGGQNAILDLCEAHARTTESAEQYPVVMLDSGSYDHKIKSRGRIKYPIFKIVDRVEAAPFNAMIAEVRGGAAFTPTSAPPLATSGTGPIAITSGRQPPTPPEPPPIEDYDGPSDGGYPDGDSIPF